MSSARQKQKANVESQLVKKAYVYTVSLFVCLCASLYMSFSPCLPFFCFSVSYSSSSSSVCLSVCLSLSISLSLYRNKHIKIKGNYMKI